MFRYEAVVFAVLRFVSVQKLVCKNIYMRKKNVTTCPTVSYSGCQVSNMMFNFISIVLSSGEAEEVVLVP